MSWQAMLQVNTTYGPKSLPFDTLLRNYITYIMGTIIRNPKNLGLSAGTSESWTGGFECSDSMAIELIFSSV